MRRLAPLTALCLTLALACYTDDVSGPGGGKPANPVVRVHLTDAPFPFDSVQSVNIYVDSIEATTTFDTSGGTQTWVTLAAPHQAVNLLDYQNGALAFLGQGNASLGQYQAVRMTLDVDSSSILLSGNVKATVHWGSSGRITIYALVSPAFTIADSVSDLVLDFDVGRSFPYDLFGTKTFEFVPWIRAVNSAQTGGIQGTVTTSYYGSPQPVANADVMVFEGNQTSSLLATGRTDASGHYRVSYLPAGTYTMSVTQPIQPGLATVTLTGLNVTVGGVLTQDVSLPAAGNGGPGVHITGPNTVGVGGVVILYASVSDSQGHAVPNPSITWSVSDTTIAGTLGYGTLDSTYGKAEGTVVVRATSGAYQDSLTVLVTNGGSLGPVNTVVIMPDSMNIPLSVDSLGFYAQPYSADSTPLYDRPVAWFISDTTVARLTAHGQGALITPLKVGTATVSATSEGKTGIAKLTIH